MGGEHPIASPFLWSSLGKLRNFHSSLIVFSPLLSFPFSFFLFFFLDSVSTDKASGAQRVPYDLARFFLFLGSVGLGIKILPHVRRGTFVVPHSGVVNFADA